jgi:hypothetical protein
MVIRRFVVALAVAGLSVSLVWPPQLTSAASPEPSGSDPKAKGSGGTGTEAVTAASETISVTGGPLTITVTDGLGCDVDHIADPQHGEFYGETACATLVAVDGVLFRPASIPAGGAAAPYTAYTPVSQILSGNGDPGNPAMITTVVTLGSTGLRLTEQDVYVAGAESYTTTIDLVNTAGSDRHVVVYRAGDCYLQNSDFGFGRSDPVFGSVACQAGQDDGSGNQIPAPASRNGFRLPIPPTTTRHSTVRCGPGSARNSRSRIRRAARSTSTTGRG